MPSMRKRTAAQTKSGHKARNTQNRTNATESDRSDGTNSNSNHSQDILTAVKRGRPALLEPKVNKDAHEASSSRSNGPKKNSGERKSTSQCKKVASEQSSKRSRNANESRNLSESEDLTEKAEFIEDGELIQMEINDGGAAAAEFQSDYDSVESDSESEEECDTSQEMETSEVEASDSEPMNENMSTGETSRQDGQNQSEPSAAKTSVEDKIDNLSSTIEVMKEIFMKSGIMKSGTNAEVVSESSGVPNQEGQRVAHKKRKHARSSDRGMSEFTSNSETTIYHNALNRTAGHTQVDPEIMFKMKETPLNDDQEDRQNNSSSSEDRIDTSDEFMDVDINERFIADCEAEARRRSGSREPQGEARGPPHGDDGRAKAHDAIRRAEAGQANIYSMPGNVESNNKLSCKATDVDDNYIMIGARSSVDAAIQEKIKLGQYVDFSRLLPRDRVTHSIDEGRMELIHKDGQTYFIPATDRGNSCEINNFYRWEQAFRVFSNIYLREHPERAIELIQYNHVICTAASTYTWDNVYAYDREFRMHMAEYPMRNWSVILQQAWTMLLKDRAKRS